MRSLKDIRESKVPGTPKKMNMKKLFRRNQIIITTLAVMIAACRISKLRRKTGNGVGNRRV